MLQFLQHKESIRDKTASPFRLSPSLGAVMNRTLILHAFLVVILSPLVAAAQSSADLQPGTYAIRDARVVLEPGTVLEKATVVIRDGLIVAVGPDAAVPPDALVIEGKGLTVYPGLRRRRQRPRLRRGAAAVAGRPAAPEDIAADPLAATKPDNRKGLTPEFAVQTALKLDEEAVGAVAAGRVHRPPRDAGGGLLLGHERARQPERIGPAGRDPSAPVALHARFGRVAGSDYPRRTHGRRRPQPADAARRRLAEAAVGGLRGPRANRQAAGRRPVPRSALAGPRRQASRSRSRPTPPTRSTAPSTSPRSSS